MIPTIFWSLTHDKSNKPNYESLARSYTKGCICLLVEYMSQGDAWYPAHMQVDARSPKVQDGCHLPPTQKQHRWIPDYPFSRNGL